MSVQSDDTEDISLYFKELTCHQLVVLIICNREQSLINDLAESVLGNRHALIALDVRKIREIFAGLASERKSGLKADNRDIIVGIRLNDNVAVRKLSYNVREHFSVDGHNASLLDTAFHDRLNAKLSVICNKMNLLISRIDQNAFENRHGSAYRNSFQGNIDAFCEFRLAADNFHLNSFDAKNTIYKK